MTRSTLLLLKNVYKKSDTSNKCEVEFETRVSNKNDSTFVFSKINYDKQPLYNFEEDSTVFLTVVNVMGTFCWVLFIYILYYR